MWTMACRGEMAVIRISYLSISGARQDTSVGQEDRMETVGDVTFSLLSNYSNFLIQLISRGVTEKYKYG